MTAAFAALGVDDDGVAVDPGDGPLVLGLPHTGTACPEAVKDALNATGRALTDTDWHVERLFEGLLPGATTVRTRVHRYVIDANRDPSGISLYPGQNTTGLVPLTDFDGQPIWKRGCEPDETEIARRRERYHRPYHAALGDALTRVRERHGVAILFDCHSIRSKIPYLFEGRLPDLNVGTDGGRTCDPQVEASVVATCAGADGYSHVLNGRFRGGWTTRHYGRPHEGWHASQLEIAQRTYMNEAPPFDWAHERATKLQAVLKTILERLDALAPNLGAPR